VSLKLFLVSFVLSLISQVVEEFSLHIILSRSEGIRFKERIIFDPQKTLVKKITREIPTQTCDQDHLVVDRAYKHDFHTFPHTKVPLGDMTQINIYPKKDYFEGRTTINLEYRCKKFWSYQDDLAKGILHVKGFYFFGLPQKTEILIYRAKTSKRNKKKNEKLKVSHSCQHDPRRPIAPFTGLTSVQCLILQNLARGSACSVKEVDSATASVVPNLPLSPDQTLIISMSGPKENFYSEKSSKEHSKELGWFVMILAFVLGGWGLLITLGLLPKPSFIEK
jgi:hypothetical protein